MCVPTLVGHRCERRAHHNKECACACTLTHFVAVHTHSLSLSLPLSLSLSLSLSHSLPHSCTDLSLIRSSTTRSRDQGKKIQADIVYACVGMVPQSHYCVKHFGTLLRTPPRHATARVHATHTHAHTRTHTQHTQHTEPHTTHTTHTTHNVLTPTL